MRDGQTAEEAIAERMRSKPPRVPVFFIPVLHDCHGACAAPRDGRSDADLETANLKLAEDAETARKRLARLAKREDAIPREDILARRALAGLLGRWGALLGEIEQSLAHIRSMLEARRRAAPKLTGRPKRARSSAASSSS